MQGRFLAERELTFARHSRGRENHDLGKIGLENLERGIDPAFVRNDHPQWIRRLTTRFAFRAHLRIGQAEPDIVVRESAAANQDRVA